jgi:hypothetical protein
MGRSIVGMLAWLAWLIPRAMVHRRADWVAVLGRGDGAFVDNCKYFYIGAQADAAGRVVYITSHDNVLAGLRAAGVPALRYPGLMSTWFLLRAGAAVVDTTEWTQRGRGALLSGSRVVQLWHGVGFKRIELDRWRHESTGTLAFRIRCFLYRLSGRLVRYDAVLITSRFYARELFEKAFLARTWLQSNYPRNTFGRGPQQLPDLVKLGVDSSAVGRIDEWAASGLRVVLIAPTFRDDGSDSLPMNASERERIERFCEDENVRLVFKLHPLDRSEVVLSDDVSVVCNPQSDVYPVLGRVAALVTDYSSIYMDFLATDRPVLFHVPDINGYVAHRETQFDIAEMTPGPKSENWDQLLDNLSAQLRRDAFRDERHRLRALAFDDNDPADSVATILSFLHDPNGIAQ